MITAGYLRLEASKEIEKHGMGAGVYPDLTPSLIGRSDGKKGREEELERAYPPFEHGGTYIPTSIAGTLHTSCSRLIPIIAALSRQERPAATRSWHG
jgi:hypothetical protein